MPEDDDEVVWIGCAIFCDRVAGCRWRTEDLTIRCAS